MTSNSAKSGKSDKLEMYFYSLFLQLFNEVDTF